jgi:phosphohistidine phosphatase SixA
MLVTLLRHGVAVDRADPRSPPDFERPLTVEGRNRAEAALRGLRALGVKPDRVLASPWLRCQQTARLAVQVLGLPRRALVTSELLAPAVDPRAIWEHLAALEADSVLLVGHGGTLEPIAGVALGLPTTLPGAPPPPADLAYRALALRKAGALQLEVRFAPRALPEEASAEAPVAASEFTAAPEVTSAAEAPVAAPEAPVAASDFIAAAPGPESAAAPTEVDLVRRPAVEDARLAWKLPARLLRQIGR